MITDMHPTFPSIQTSSTLDILIMFNVQHPMSTTSACIIPPENTAPSISLVKTCFPLGVHQPHGHQSSDNTCTFTAAGGLHEDTIAFLGWLAGRVCLRSRKILTDERDKLTSGESLMNNSRQRRSRDIGWL
jgi:hypothetical protein